MDKERDEILNELIKYYDGDVQEAPEKPEEESIDNTIVIHKSTPAPQEETLGDTMVVKPKASSEKEQVQTIEETTAVHIPQKAPEPVEEVFGNLGLDGKPLIADDTENSEPPKRRRIDIEPVVFNHEPEEEYSQDRTGIWYALKPLWATMIVCMCIFFVFVLYVKGYVRTYIYNFTSNLEFICESLGIDYPFTEDVSVNPYPSVLSGDTDIELSPSEAGEGYTERNNVHEETESGYAGIKEQKKLLPFDEAGSSDFSAYKNGVVCTKSNYICFLNASGKTEWEYSTSVPNPILSTAGDYIAIAAKNGTQVSLYNGADFVYSTDAPARIKTCRVSEEGDVVIVTEKTSYKGAVVVINKNGEEVFSWASGINYITSASPVKGRNVAVVLADTSSRVKSYIMMFDIKSPDPTGGIELTETLVYDASYSGNTVYASGDNSIVSVNPDGETNYDIRFDDVHITRSDSDHRGNRLVTFTKQHIPAMNVYNKNGELVYSGNIEASPDCIDIYGTTVLYNNGRDIMCGDIKDETLTAYTAPMAVKDLILLNSSTYVIVYEDTLEFIGI